MSARKRKWVRFHVAVWDKVQSIWKFERRYVPKRFNKLLRGLVACWIFNEGQERLGR